ncbi:cysteine proteinase inhibitor 1-like [Pyrus communis]|uniref:cysteine proteinase inhibitor 1-like n=1 Tax=Pyrus communis TaxID=23211 RepID=UPI0035BF470E
MSKEIPARANMDSNIQDSTSQYLTFHICQTLYLPARYAHPNLYYLAIPHCSSSVINCHSWSGASRRNLNKLKKATVTMRPHCLLILALVLLPLVAAAADRRGLITGGWEPIKNISDPHVKEIAEFAVSEYNKQAQGQNKLAFERVVRGDSQVVAGINYRLVISAKNKSVADPDVATPADYEGIVWEKAWEHFKQLMSFHRLSKPN